MKTGFITGLTLLIMSVTLQGCFKDHRVDGNYNVINEERTLDAFTVVETNGDFHVIIQQDTIDKVEVEAESNLQPFIVTYVSGEKLVIEKKRFYNLDNHLPLIIRIHTKELKGVALNGSGKIEATQIENSLFFTDLNGSGSIHADVETDHLIAALDGSGKIYLTGQAKQSDYKINGSGKIDADNLETDECNVDVNGSGNIYVNVIKRLDVIINGSGNVYYMGSPEESVRINGSGEVIAITR